MTNGQLKALRSRFADMKELKDKVASFIEVLESLRDDLEGDLDICRDVLGELNDEDTKPADLEDPADDFELSVEEIESFDEALTECEDAFANRYC